MARRVTFRGAFSVHQPDDDDLRRAAALPLGACPRRYCWWWRSLAFEWDVDPQEGCQFLCSQKPPGWKNVDRPCTRSGASNGVDHYEPREPHLIEDGFEEDRFVAPRSTNPAPHEMRMAGGGSELVLTIEGYEFPELEGEKWDSNWLLVKLDLRSAGESWTKVDPALLTWEVEALASWFLAIAASTSVPQLDMRFVESFLRFQLLPDSRTLRVEADYGRLRMEVPVDADVLRACAVSLRSQLKHYPRRAERRP